MFSRITPAVFVFAMSGWAQVDNSLPPPAEIRGVVLEAGSGTPIAGVDVAATLPNIGSDRYPHASTDANGAFYFPANVLGPYFGLTALKQGYTEARSSFMVAGRVTHQESYRLELRRVGELRGRVVDADTGEAAGGVRVTVPNRFAMTQDDGTFTVVPSTDKAFVLHFEPDFRHSLPFTPEDAAVVDRDVVSTAWPPTGVLNTQAGTITDLGTIRVKRVPLYRMRVDIPAEGCAAGTHYVLELWERTKDGKRNSNLGHSATCGQDQILTGMPPGSYFAYFRPLGSPEELWAVVPIEIKDANIRLQGSVMAGATLPVRIVGAEGAGKLPDDLEVVMTSEFFGPWTARSARSDAGGHAELKNVPAIDWNVAVKGLPPGWVLSEVRYNGATAPRKLAVRGPEQPGRGMPLDPDLLVGAGFEFNGSGSLELVIDDRPGSIRGMLTPRSYCEVSVGLLPWSTPARGYPIEAARVVRPDATGMFVFEGLPEGRYRVFTVPGGGRISQQGIDRNPPIGKDVEVPRGGTASSVDLSIEGLTCF